MMKSDCAAFRFLIVLCLVLINQSALAQSGLIPKTWQSAYFADNPLVGKTFDGAGKPVTETEITTALSTHDFVLLGETHSNADHHIIQARALEALVAAGRTPAVILEMVPAKLANQLNNPNLDTDPQLDDLAKRLKWEERGWFTWEIYRPIAMAAVRNKLPLVAGNLDREVTRSVSRKGIGALPKLQQERYGLQQPLPDTHDASLQKELADSHCGLLPEQALAPMAMVQRARDGSMADALLQANSGNGAVLIAGRGHVRRDRGVAFPLRLLAPGKSIVSVGLMEVDEKRTRVEDYRLEGDDGKPLFNFVIFTPRSDIKDHCAELKKRFKKSQPKNGN